MQCEFCKCEHDGTYGSGRFCSYTCKQKFVHYARKDFSSRCGIQTQCPVCGTVFSSKLDAAKHCKAFKHYKLRKRRPRPFRWKCSRCKELFRTKTDLVTHKHSCTVPYRCDFCGATFDSCGRYGAHLSLCRANPAFSAIAAAKSLSGIRGRGRKHSAAARRKMSDIKKAYYAAHPGDLPFVRWHSSKESYAERYFARLFRVVGVSGFKREFHCIRFFLDFAFVDDKVDFEVDGSQHYDCCKIVEHDKTRTELLERAGWKVIRVRWSEWCKLSKNEKRTWLQDNLYCHLTQFKRMGV